MSASLLARHLSLSHGNSLILNDVSVTIGPETRLGIVGSNGAGKSTLLKMLAEVVVPDTGSVTKAPDEATVGYLSQEPEHNPEETVLMALARRTGVAAAHIEFEDSTLALAAGVANAEDRYSAALDRWLRLGAADFEARVRAVADDLGLADTVLGQATSKLSGGQAARVSLASILLARYDIVLLDEPTNDLDFDGLERLERFVAQASAGVVIVSHDRAFLERTISSVLELDEHSHSARLFNGGWLSYLDERAVDRRHAEASYNEHQTKRAALEERAHLQRQWAIGGTHRTTKSPKDKDKAQRYFFLNRTEKQASKVRITEKAIERLGKIKKPWEGWQLHLELGTAQRSGDLVFRLCGAVVEHSSFQLGPIDLEMNWAERVAILGANGTGKTTLLEALLGRLPLSSGNRFIGPGVIVGEFDQARRLFAGTETLLRTFEAELGASRLPRSELRSLLAKFGLGATHLDRPTFTLSPGERGRAMLAMFMAREVNCLVFDEPTNHLDLPAIEQLEQALESWCGTLLLISHDRRLLDTVRLDRTIQLGAERIDTTAG